MCVCTPAEVLHCGPAPGPLDVLLFKIFLVFGVFTFLFVCFVQAPYGKHLPAKRAFWEGPRINGYVAWVIMEGVSPMALIAAFFLGLPSVKSVDSLTVALVLFTLWIQHYVYRTIVYPMRCPSMGTSTSVVLLAGVVFNFLNGWLNGRYITCFLTLPLHHLLSFNFLAGLAVFIFGAYITRSSERILQSLRKPGERGYKIPTGGFFHYVSCPHYLGETVQWMGFAMCTNYNSAALLFFMNTVLNLWPRAVHSHKWYLEKFKEDYPKERKAIVPYLL